MQGQLVNRLISVHAIHTSDVSTDDVCFKLLAELASLLLLTANRAVDQGQPQHRQREKVRKSERVYKTVF